MAPQESEMKCFLMLIITQLSRFMTVEFRDLLARVIGNLWYLVSGGRREVVRNNIKKIKGEVTEESVKEVFINFARVYSDILALPAMSSSYVKSMVRVVDIDNLSIPLRDKRGAILVASHLGGMEFAGPYLSSLGYELYSIAESSGPGESFFNFYKNYREHLGNTILRLEDEDLYFKLVKLIKENKIVVLVSDRDIQKSGGRYNFFGAEASIPKGVPLISKRTGAPLVVGYMVLHPDTPRYLGKIFKPIYPEDYESIDELMEAMLDKLESGISKYPEQWFVFQRVWEN